MSHDSNNIMVILSSPSGAGKTTISKKIQQKYQNFKISVSHTTRKPRPNEIDGVDYHFISKNEFEKLIKANNFYEHAKIFDNYYGTSKNSVNKLHEENYDVIFDIDWQGEQQLKQSARDDLASVFILPPSTEELGRRLRQRAQDPSEVLITRMEKAPDEISHWPEYDYIVINKKIEETVAQVQSLSLIHI